MDDTARQQALQRLIQAQEKAIAILDEGYEKVRSIHDQNQIASIHASLQTQ